MNEVRVLRRHLAETCVLANWRQVLAERGRSPHIQFLSQCDTDGNHFLMSHSLNLMANKESRNEINLEIKIAAKVVWTRSHELRMSTFIGSSEE